MLPFGTGTKAPVGVEERSKVTFAPASGTPVQMLFKRLAFGAVERSERVERQVFPELFVHAHAANTFRNEIRPARILVLTVPSGSPVFSAIST